MSDVPALYAAWPDKGKPTDGLRATVLSERTRYRPGEEIAIQHVIEAEDPRRQLYVMGPKPVVGEHLDGRPVTPPPLAGENPYLPAEYDGRTIPGPGIDSNFEVTRYRFGEPGSHEVVWKLGALESNVLRLDIG